MSQPRAKKLKPLRGKSRLERLVARIANEEKLLEILDKELPEQRIRIFHAMRPHLRFKLSPTFLPANLPKAPYIGDPKRIPQADPTVAHTPAPPLEMTGPTTPHDAIDGRTLFNPNLG